MTVAHSPRPRTGDDRHAGSVLLLNKPWGVLCQFSSSGERPTLKSFVNRSDVYPAGRLDADSEGLVVLTGDGVLQARITDPRHKLPKSYWVEVEGDPHDAALAQLARGITLRDGPTLPSRVRRIDPPARMWPRDPPIRVRKSIPTAWLDITLVEGRNRQVRRMTAAVGLPTLRLVRHRVGPWTLGSLAPGEWREEVVDSRVLSSAAASIRSALAPRRSSAASAPRRTSR